MPHISWGRTSSELHACRLERSAGRNERLDFGGIALAAMLGAERASAGESDAWGYKPLDRSSPTEVYDIHATILHLLGIDHTKLTIRNNGIDRRLTGVHGHVLREVLA